MVAPEDKQRKQRKQNDDKIRKQQRKEIQKEEDKLRKEEKDKLFHFRSLFTTIIISDYCSK